MKEKACSVGTCGEEVPAQHEVHDLVWALVFRELGNQEMVQLAYEIVQCSMMDQDCRHRALKALREVID
ncbi:hypothetical protein AKJ36_00145 [candidate division MSBL1 archaeon SCGC-AAA259I07]|uniref:HEAT repeat domain-containing protein n=1 Tax=candidate division MSBL1 archaeon SCGC-AAA259I07 TaxID=1698266 RepID=A0A133UMY8_9EURY|nr:hypothetical protein AKJ36_00145 [candidate division MSBL1 archaeon SCGC-AAA259I07]